MCSILILTVSTVQQLTSAGCVLVQDRANTIEEEIYFCHTRLGGNTYPIPKGSKNGPMSGFIITHPARKPLTLAKDWIIVTAQINLNLSWD